MYKSASELAIYQYHVVSGYVSSRTGLLKYFLVFEMCKSQVEDLFAERHVVADHPPNIDIQRHTNHNIDPVRLINRPCIEAPVLSSSDKPGPSNGHVS